MTEFQFTGQQKDILKELMTNDGIILVSAGAGCGKTFISKQSVQLVEPVKCLYTAFNKAIVAEGEQTFDYPGMEFKTFHALAWKHVHNGGKIEDLGYRCIVEDISYQNKKIIIKTINDFFVSNSLDMYEFMDDNIETGDEDTDNLLKNLAVQYIDQMAAGTISHSFNYMLKALHLKLANGTVQCKYDMVILDEINDVTAVSLEIFKLIDSPKKLGLGETNQAIYDFLNLVNGFEELTDVTVMPLTQSFRCSKGTANKLQKFMRAEVTDDFTFTGTDDPIANGKKLYCTLTNAKIIEEISHCLSLKKGFYLLRDIKDIFAYPLAIVGASRGNKVYRKQYKFLEDEYKTFKKNRTKGLSFYQHLLDEVGDQETTNAVNLLMTMTRKNQDIFKIYEQAKNAKVDPHYTIATVFTAKGLEFETVYIGDDLNNRINSIRAKGGIVDHEDLVAYRCYYVACSRAGKELVNATCLTVK